MQTEVDIGLSVAFCPLNKYVNRDKNKVRYYSAVYVLIIKIL